MFTLFLTIEPYIRSIRTRSRAILSPRSLGQPKATLHHGWMLALFVVLSIMVVPVLACALPFTVSPREPWTAPVGSVNPRGIVGRN
jgi:hypothetical protein